MAPTKSKRLDRLKAAWWINDWSSKLMSNKTNEALSQTREYPSGIILKSNVDSIAMTKTKEFLSNSLMSSKGIEGTIIFGSTFTDEVPELHEILLNIQPFGWIYIPEGKK
jgi:hypothetical protein